MVPTFLSVVITSPFKSNFHVKVERSGNAGSLLSRVIEVV